MHGPWPWLLAFASIASAAVQGFNYGALLPNGAVKQQSDFEAEFLTARNLVGTSGFTSARLYTTIQGPSANDPISAIPAAIKTKTSLLLGLWASAGDAAFANEVEALKKAITTYGDDFTNLVDGISVGSEDLYRTSPIGIEAGSLPGTGPDTLARYIGDVRKAIAGTKLSGAPIGHVDTWTAWVNTSNKAVIDACDWLGFDGYPYFQGTMPNKISLGQSLFDASFGETQAHSGGKPVWIAETGWPVSGKTVNEAVASPENAKAYWDAVGCQRLFGKINTWWFTLRDAPQSGGNPSFGVVGESLGTTPLYDLSCDRVPGDATSSTSQISTPNPTPTQPTTTQPSGPPASSLGNTISSSSPSLPPPPGSTTANSASSGPSTPSNSADSPSSSPSSGSSSGSSGPGSGSAGSGASSISSRVNSPSPSGTSTAGPGSASASSTNAAAAGRLPPRQLGGGFVAIIGAILAL